MKRLFSQVLFAVTALACGTTLSAATITFTAHPFDVNGGGQFTANISSPPSTGLAVYCVDFLNYVSLNTTYTLSGISSLANLSATNYGNSASSAFTYFTNVYTASQRYLMAGYLTTQFNLGAGGGDSNNQAIQNAIWDLLDTNGSLHNAGTYLTAATNWLAAGNTSAIAAGLTIYDGYNSYTNARMQEMVHVTLNTNVATPEPGTVGLLGLGLGLVALGARRRRVRRL
jgi:hypothetical protein